MELSDNDLQAMDAVIDGNASADEVEQVRALTSDPAVAFVMEQLRADRTSRVAAFASMEPDNAAVERFHWRLNAELADARSAERATLRGGGWSLSRVGSVAAACVAVGFFGGWIGRGAPLRPSKTVQPYEVSDNRFQQPPVATNTPADEITVPVSNEYGQVVAFQKFRNSADARSFTEDLNRANSSTGDDHVRLMSNEKY